MKTLDEIAIECGTDKASRHPTGAHDYCVHYARFFGPKRNNQIRLLEIGVGGGESIRTWLEYFPHGQIRGIDLNQNTNPWNTPGSGAHSRYQFLQGNQSDRTMWACMVANWGGDFDFIIDDGSHMSGDIVTAFQCLWPILKSGGIYAVEDTGVTYTSGSVFNSPGFPSHSEWICDQVKIANQGSNDLESVFVFHELVLLIKQ